MHNAGVLMLRSLARRPIMFGAAILLALMASLAITASLQDRTPVCRALSIDGATGAPRLEWGLILTKDQEIDCLRRVATQVGPDGLPAWLASNGFRVGVTPLNPLTRSFVITGFYPNVIYRRPKAPTWHWFLSNGQSISFAYSEGASGPRIRSNPIML